MNSGKKSLGRPLSRLLIATAVIAASPAQADDKAEIEKLRAQILELDQKLRVLDRKQELAAEDLAAKQKAAPIVSAGDKGFAFKSADGQFEYKLRGLLQFDYRSFSGDAYPDAIDGFLARRLRPTFEGTVFGNYGFRFTPEFGEGKSSVVDAYVDIKQVPEAQVRIGKFKPFVGLERLQGGADTKFIERSYVSNNILPNRDLGISVFGDVLNNKLSYAVGLFNGVADGAEATTAQDITSEKEYTARLFATPFAGDGSALQGLGFGIATTYGNNIGTTSVDARGRVSAISSGLGSYKTPGQANTFFNYTSSVSTNTNTVNDFVLANGRHVRWTPQAYYYYGPLGVLAEYAESSQAVASYKANASWVYSENKSGTVESNAFQVAASWLLTGEDASFKGVKPLSPFRLGADGGWGAIELVARYQENSIGKDAAHFADKQKGYALGAKTTGIGLNWYLNDASKLSVNYDYTQLKDVTAATSAGLGTPATVAKNPLSGTTEHLLVARYQLAF
ncbi:MAG: hypothetical protein RL404_859 [Pseudomonadota bacterium]